MENSKIEVPYSLCEMCYSLHSIQDLSKALDILSSTIIDTLKVKGCSIKVLNERHNKLEIFSIKGMSEEFLKNTGVYKMFKSSFNQEALKGNMVYIEDIEKETSLEVPEELKMEGIHAVACIPIRIEKQIIGVLSVYHDQLKAFEPEERAFLEAISLQGAAVINSLRNFQRMQTLLNLVKTIHSSLDLDQVLNEVVIQVTRAMKCRAASIRLLNESTNLLVFKTSFGLSKNYLENIPKTLEKSPVDRQVLEKKEVVYVEDMTTDLGVTLRSEAEKEGLSSMLCIPLSLQDKTIGILKIYTSAPTVFTNEEIQFLQSLSELSVIAISNASLYSKLHSLYQVTSSLTATLETKHILDLIAIHATDYIQAMGAQILIWDKEKEKFTSRVIYKLDKGFIDSLNLTKDSWSARETLKGNTIIVSDLEKDERPDIRDNALKAGIKSFVSIPLITMDRVTGVLQIYCKLPRNFTSDEIEFLTTLANHGAVAIENARIHEHLKSEYDRLIDDIYVWHDWTSYVIRE